MRTKEQLKEFLDKYSYPHPTTDDLNGLLYTDEWSKEEVEELARLAGYKTPKDIEKMENDRFTRKKFEYKQRKACIPSGIYQQASIHGLQNGIKSFTDVVCSFKNDFKAKGILIVGPEGTSKTYTACAILNSILRRTNKTAKYIDFSQYVSGIEDNDNATAYNHRLCQIDALVVDNVEVYKLSDYKLQKFLQLISQRDVSNKHTILATSLSTKEFKDYLGENANKSTSKRTIRIIDQYDFVTVTEYVERNHKC